MDWKISLLLASASLIFVFLEFFLPGGVMAAMGCFLACSSVIFAMLVDIKLGLYIMLGLGPVLGIVIWFALRSVKNSQLVLADELSKREEIDQTFFGKEAIVTRDLKPSGYIQIDGVEYQAISNGQYLKKDSKVTIVSGDGAKFIVRS